MRIAKRSICVLAVVLFVTGVMAAPQNATCSEPDREGDDHRGPRRASRNNRGIFRGKPSCTPRGSLSARVASGILSTRGKFAETKPSA